MTDLTQEELKRLLSYSRLTGLFTWKQDAARNVKAGSTAGNLNCYGYVRIRINGRGYAAHRLAWLYVHGKWPEKLIDHRNRKKSDNRIRNLRDCTVAQNSQNRRPAKPYLTPQGKWAVSIKHNKKNTFLGVFATYTAAEKAYTEAKKKLHFN